MDYDQQTSPSFRHRIKASIRTSLCFATNYADQFDLQDSDNLETITRRRSPSPSRRRSGGLFSRIGWSSRRSGGNSTDFRYDPLSYALNFEDDSARIDDFPLGYFSARFPASPEKQLPSATDVSVSRERIACS